MDEIPDEHNIRKSSSTWCTMMLNNLKRSNIAQHFTNSTAKREESTIKKTVCGRRRVTSAWDSRSRWSLIDLILEDASDEWHTLTHHTHSVHNTANAHLHLLLFCAAAYGGITRHISDLFSDVLPTKHVPELPPATEQHDNTDWKLYFCLD